jgi:hypothetical protein
MIYFARRGDHVKIGVSTQPEVRGLLFGDIVRIEEGDRSRERELHHRWSSLRETPSDLDPRTSTTEWFRIERDLAEYLRDPDTVERRYREREALEAAHRATEPWEAPGLDMWRKTSLLLACSVTDLTLETVERVLEWLNIDGNAWDIARAIAVEPICPCWRHNDPVRRHGRREQRRQDRVAEFAQ